jgi:hypothetical protein
LGLCGSLNAILSCEILESAEMNQLSGETQEAAISFTARKPSEVDSGSQSSERFQPFTLPTPSWMLALHDPFLTVFRARVVGLNRSESAAREAIYLLVPFIAPTRLKSKENLAEFYPKSRLRSQGRARCFSLAKARPLAASKRKTLHVLHGTEGVTIRA